ncbi:DUF6624 domain-containing protein [Aeoliella mucimassa]|uniref:Uncharacterized protein n=1 Tax=Aeoliella mucimassa TaxID=2527972 RepID=A0A518AR42_9BACT|nr:DUF6624 domain-containing protein [Aeoliella mucimassa]QDU57185.1 hypothetical protein Pan181_33990 [Aeoliella mucimassa]
MKSLTALLAMALNFATAILADEPTATEQNTRSALTRELQRRWDVDQQARKALLDWEQTNGRPYDDKPAEGDSSKNRLQEWLKTTPLEYQRLAERLKQVDADNTAWLRKLVDTQGWPTISQVGQQGSEAAWLLVQHADRSPEFQLKCLTLMNELPQHEVSQQNVAYLTDRVLVAQGKPQKFGTQLHVEAGELVLRPTQDEATLDERRAAIGLQPVADYLQMARQMYGYSADEVAESNTAPPTESSKTAGGITTCSRYAVRRKCRTRWKQCLGLRTHCRRSSQQNCKLY